MLEAVLDTFSLVLYLQTPLGVARLGGGGHRVSAATLEISLSLKTASPCSLNQSYLARVDVIIIVALYVFLTKFLSKNEFQNLSSF